MLTQELCTNICAEQTKTIEKAFSFFFFKKGVLLAVAVK